MNPSRMPSSWRHLSFRCMLPVLCAISLMAFAQTIMAQSSDQAPADVPSKKASAARTQTDLPSAEAILILTRSTLLTLNDALRTGNFTVLRDLSAPSLANANSAGKLYQIFSNLAQNGIDLSAIAILAPQFPQTPFIDENGILHIDGFFPGRPVEIHFQIAFQVVGRYWRLLTLSVRPVDSDAADSSTSTSKPEQTEKR